MKRVKHNSWFRAVLISAAVVLSCFAFAIGIAASSLAEHTANAVARADGEEVNWTLYAVNVTVKDGYVFTGVDVSNSNSAQVLGLIDIEVVYVDPAADPEDGVNFTRTLKVDPATMSAETGENVSNLALSDDNKLSVTVTAGGVSVTGETIDEVDTTTAPTYNGITATYNGTLTLTSSYNPSQLNSAAFQDSLTVRYTYNNGTVDNETVITNADFSVDGNLFPDSIPGEGMGSEPYSKNLTVKLTESTGHSDFTTEVEIYGIKFNPDFNILYISGSLAQQYARSSLSFENNNLGMGVMYGRIFFNVSLASFGNDSFYDIKYYAKYNGDLDKGEDELSGVTVLTTSIGAVEFTFKFPGTENIGSAILPIRIDPIQIETPYFNTEGVGSGNGTSSNPLHINYSNDVSINIGMPSYSEYEEGDLPDVKITVSEDAKVLPKDAELGGYNTIKFAKPDKKYKIEVTLPSNGDFQWAQPTGGGVRNDTADIITYYVFIDKAHYDLTALSGTFEWEYEPNHNVTDASITVQNDNGWVENNEPVFTQVPYAQNAGESLAGLTWEYHLEYYGWDGVTVDNPSLDAPVNAGRYKVVAVTHENEYYYSARLEMAVDVTVNPKIVKKQDVVQSITYDGKTHTASEFLHNDANNIYADDIKDGKLPIEVSGTTSFTYFETDGYAVTLKLTNENYIWDKIPEAWDSTQDDIMVQARLLATSFVINKRIIQYNVAQGDFYYGDSSTAAFSANLADAADDKYLTAPTIDYSNGTNSYNDRSLIDTWNAGSYTVTYTPVYKGGNDNEKQSLDLRADTVRFEIKRAQVKKIVITDDSSKTYSGKNYSYIFTNWSDNIDEAIINGGLGGHTDLSFVRTRSVKGDRIGSVTILPGDSVQLRYADKYSVEVKLLDTDNFEWSDGTTDDITVTWIINKAEVDKADVPVSVSYNHSAQKIELDNWKSDKMNVTKISGKAFDESAITGGFTSIPADGDDSGEFALTFAGKYTITVALKDKNNYKWAGETDDESEPIELTYVLERALLALDKTSGEIDFDESAEEQALPTLVAKKVGGGTLTSTEIALTFDIADADGNIISKITEAGTYTLTVKKIVGGTEANNYYIPDDLTHFIYTVKSFGLAMPTIITADGSGFDYSIVYDGAEHSFTEFIQNYAKDYINSANGGAKLIVKVYGDKIIRNAATYTVYVYPAANYAWNNDVTGYIKGADGDDMRNYFKYDFVIEQLEVEIDWSDTELPYNETARAPKADITNKKNSKGETGTPDDVSIVIRYEEDGSVTEVTNAGRYKAYAYELAGDDIGNYKLTKDKNPNYSTDFTITKQVLTIPELKTVTGRNYGDSDKTVNLVIDNADGVWAYLDGKVTATVTGKNPWTGNNDEVLDGTFDVKSGTFTYVNAGAYYIVFTLTDSKNYCLNSTQKYDFAFEGNYFTGEPSHFITIDRQVVTPFYFGGDRAYQWEGYNSLKIYPSGVFPVSVEVKFGQYKLEGDKWIKEDEKLLSDEDKAANNSNAIGQYYVRLSITEPDLLNYVWGDYVWGDGEELSDYVLVNDSKEYGQGLVAIYLSYAITNSQLIVEFKVKEGGYTFGDNGVGKNISKFADVIVWEKTVTDAAGVQELKFNKVVFKDKDGNTVSDLEKGLPWNAGDYTVSFEVQFDDGGQYQDLPVTDLAFTVSRLKIDVDWHNLSKTYDGETKQDIVFANVASLINVPERESGLILPPTLVIRSTGEPVNVNTYTIAVIELKDDNADNFTVVGSSTAQFVINEREISIVGITPEKNHVYGDELPDISRLWKYSDGSEKFVDSQDHIKITLVQNGSEISYNGTPGVGVYNIIIAWDNADESYAKNYSVNFNCDGDNIAKFTIVEREITVTITDITKTYYDEVDYTGAYSVETSNGDGRAVVGDNPFILVAKDGNTEITQAANVKTAGYPIYITKTDGNYIITVTYKVNDTLLELNKETDTGAKYKVNPADITNVSVAGYNNVYDGKAHALFTTLNATALGGQTLVWYFKTAEDAEWTKYDNQTVTNVCSYSYFVKVSAANHNEYIYHKDSNEQTAVSVKVIAAELIVNVQDRTEEYKAARYYYLENSSVESKTADNLNGVKWEICVVESEDDAPADDGWKADDGQTDAGTYYFYVKVIAANHNTFVSEKPYKLEITQATLTLSVNISIFYGEANPADAKYYLSSGDAVDLISGYNAGVYRVDGLKGSDSVSSIDISGSFAYSVNNYGIGSPVSDSDYEISLTQSLSSRNYKFEIAGNTMYLTVKPLPVSATIDNLVDCTAKYLQNDPTRPIAKITTAQTSTYGDSIISLLAADTADNYANIVTVTTAALDNLAAGKTTNDAGKYDIALTLSDNYVWASGVVAQGNKYIIEKAYTVVRADNAVIDGYRLFADATVDGWTYGDKTATNPDGYDPSGKHALQTLAFVNRDASLTIKITRTADGNDAEVGSYTIDSVVSDITARLNNIFAAIRSNTGFDAGKYTVTYTVGESKNYNKLEKSYEFTVAKKIINVKPKDLEVVYGEQLKTEYGYYIDALAGYNGKTDIISDIISFEFGSFDSTTGDKGYAPGWNAGSYDIKVSVEGSFTAYDDEREEETTNYKFVFGKAELQVQKRTVTILVDNAENFYMLLLNTNGNYSDETAATFDYKAVDSSEYEFYGNQRPVVLKTDALLYAEDGSVIGTRDAGKYVIYAEFVDDIFAKNYTILFANEAIGSDVEKLINDYNAIKVDGVVCGGVFTVKKAKLTIQDDGPYLHADKTGKYDATEPDASRYDGNEKYYFADPKFPEGKEIANKPEFTTEYYLNGKQVECIKDAGVYTLYFTVSNSNINFEDLNNTGIQKTIAKRPLGVQSVRTWTGYEVTYSGSAFQTEIRFTGVVNDEELKITATVTGVSNSVLNNVTLGPSVDNEGANIRSYFISETDVGTYTVQISLDGMENYELENSVINTANEYAQAGKYTYKLTIKKATLYAVIQEATIQYGTQLFDGNKPVNDPDRISNFGVVYSTKDAHATQHDDGLPDIILANQIAGKFTQNFNYVILNTQNEKYSDGSGGTTASSAGSTFDIDIENITASNFDVKVTIGKLTVIPREIDVYVSGYGEDNTIAHNVYDGKDHAVTNGKFEQDFKANKAKYLSTGDAENPFGNAGTNIATLGVSLFINSAVNAGEYPISAKDEDGNCNITFRYGNRVLAEGNRPYYLIEPAVLKVKVQGADSTDYEQDTSIVSVTYGEQTSGLFAVRYYGWIGSQGVATTPNSFTQPTFAFDDSGYVAYTSVTGEKFVVSIIENGLIKEGVGLFGNNYTVEFIDAELLVVSRHITASTTDRVYEADTSDYHGGAWGKPLDAIITFAGVSAERMAGAYTLSYTTDDGNAPVKVGGYKVTINLNPNKIGQYNYVIDNGNVLDYSVTPRVINLEWDYNTIDKDMLGDQTTMTVTIDAYIKDIMNVISFTRAGNIAVTDYEQTNEGLSIVVGDSNGTYTVTIELKDTAKGNYELSGDRVQAVVSFVVDLDSNRNTIIEIIYMEGWQYGDDAKTPNAIVKSGGVEIVDATVTFEYAVAANSLPDGLLSLSNVSSYTWSSYTANATYSAGKYILRARYAGSADYYKANDVFYVFTVTKGTLIKPDFVGSTIYNESADGITVTVENYDASAMQISTRIQFTLIDGVLTLYAVNADKDGYPLEIAISNPNYVWSDDGTADPVILKWVVAEATDNKTYWETDNAASAVYNGAADYKMSAYTTYKRDNRIVYSYALRIDGVGAESASGWTVGLPVNAGKYWIRATGGSTVGNYNDDTVYCEFEITKKDLIVRPSGSMTYGSTFDNADTVKGYEIVSGRVDVDTESAVIRDITNIVYTVTNSPATGIWGAGSYDMTMTASATNYNIVAQNGSFVVNKARLYVTLGNAASSLYRHELNVGDTTVTLRGVTGGDVADDIIAELKGKLICMNGGVDITDSEYPIAGTYAVTLSVSEIDNYVLTVTDGIYTVNKLPVRVEVDWGGYTFNSLRVLPAIVGVYDGETLLNLTAAELELFSFVYPDGTTTAPTTADGYTVSLHIADSSNYMLELPVSGQFVIARIELDAELITWKQVYFDYTIEKPTVTSIAGNAFSEELFDISYVGDWNKAGVPYSIVLKLKYPESTKWKLVEGDECTVTYTVERGVNMLTQGIAITGWTYGEYSSVNLPTAESKFGTVVFEYASSRNGEYTTAAPVSGDAGTYWVRAVVEGTTDYERFVCAEPVSFEITKKIIGAPTLDIITEGYGQNNVYTGMAMQANVSDYNSTLMYIYYDDGTVIVSGNTIKVIATNAGVYRVRVSLVNSDNYGWTADTELDDDGNALLTWTIARKKLDKPTDNNALLMVNGQELKYYPIGFDNDIMSITGNTSGYGGTFTATVYIVDTDNYEWADGSIDPVTFEWEVVGIDSVYIAIMVVLGISVAVTAIIAALQLNKYINKKKKEEQAK